LSKAAVTYSNKAQTFWSGRRASVPQGVRPTGTRARAKQEVKWLPIGIALAITLMVCVTVNFRAYSELKREVNQNQELNAQIEAVTSENLSMQEEIHYLKNDPNMIEREARKFGFVPRKEKKVSVPDGK
jgi:hypothetical protein